MSDHLHMSPFQLYRFIIKAFIYVYSKISSTYIDPCCIYNIYDIVSMYNTTNNNLLSNSSSHWNWETVFPKPQI